MTDAGDVQKVFPLTPVQQGMLLHSVADPTVGYYVNQVVLTLRGPLRVTRLRDAWQHVLDRHAALRAAFVWEGTDQPLQVVRARVQVPWTELDWCQMSPADRQRHLTELLAADRAQPFELARAPLMRLRVLRLAEHEWWLGWTFHHLLLDGWSAHLALDDVFGQYRRPDTVAAPDGGTAPPTRPYWEYVAWLHQQDEAAAEQFWRRRLAGFSVPTSVGASHSAPSSEPTFCDVADTIPAPVRARLEDLARRNRLTLATVVQAAWVVVLSRYSGQRDVVFGSVVSGRPPLLPGVEQMVGLFSATVPARVRIDESAPLARWLAAVQAELAAGRQYEHSSLAQVQRWSDVPAGTALFDSIVAYENYPVRADWLGDDGQLAVTGIGVHERPHYPVTLVASGTDELALRLYADQRWLPAPAAERMLGHVLTVLTDITDRLATEPGGPVRQVRLLPAAERDRVLAAWADGGPPELLARTVAEALDRQARLHPDAVAVICDEQRLSYREFHERVTRLAWYLRGAGVGPDVPVAVCLERSVHLLVALLAVVRAGGCYVPIDPAYPAARIAWTLTDTGTRLVLTAGPAADRLPPSGAVRVVRLDTEADAIAVASAGPVESVVFPHNLLYVIYTSGSTGRPKGVMATHQGVLNHLGWMQRKYPIGPDDRVIQRTSVGFDASVWEVLWPFLTGATLVVPDTDAKDPERLAEVMNEHRVTVASYVPSLLDSVLTDPQRRLGRYLRLVLIAGEAFPPGLATAFRVACDAEAANVYGPTETSVSCAIWPLPNRKDLTRVSIGRPLTGTWTYVLDSELRPVPVEVPGELYVGGLGVARGYLGRAGLTAERFVPDPFGGDGARLYRTGDRVRWSPDGDLEFVGRVDFQVKVRGFRVELGEIEAVLSGHPGVRHAVVVACDQGGVSARLVAYLVPEAGSWGVPVAQLRTYLSSQLPDHMVPAVFVWLDSLPLTRNGKVDRAALPAPEGVRPELEQEFVAPRGEAERVLAVIWAEVLGVDRVGVNDNFFELGGDSILSIMVVSRAAQEGWRVTPRQFFDRHTVAELAAVAAPLAAPVGVRRQRTVPISTPDATLTPAQHWFFDHGFARPGWWNQGWLFALPADTESARVAELLGQVVDTVVRRHDALRLRFHREPGSPWQAEVVAANLVATGETVALIDLAGHSDWDAALAQALVAASEFDLGDPPLLRVLVIDGGRPERRRLALLAHHLVIDGVSWRVLLEELHIGYRQAAADEPVRLPAATTPATAWACALRELAHTPDVAADLNYWLTQSEVNGAALPPDVPSAAEAATEADTALVEVALTAEQTRLLLRDVPRAYRTSIDDVLLTALTRALSDLTAARDVVLWLEGHGREQHLVDGADLSRTLGWFTSIAPVRLTLPADGNDPRSALKAIKEQLRAVPHHGLSYGLLRYLHAERGAALAAKPVPQISFNYLGQFDTAIIAEHANPADQVLRLVPAPELLPAACHPRNRRPHLLDITAITAGGLLQITFSYSTRHHARQTVERLATGTIAQLGTLITHCTQAGITGYTPSDFPESGLDQDQLDTLLAGLTGK